MCRSFGLVAPKKGTLSRHSFLGPNGLRGQWLGPTSGMKVKFFVYFSRHIYNIYVFLDWDKLHKLIKAMV